MKDPGNSKIDIKNAVDKDEDYILTSIDTPLREDAFKLDDELKIELIEKTLKK